MTDPATAASDLTRDAFLDGRVHAWQPKTGYRAGVDPVVLAASVTARPGHRVLELGCGVGVAALCLAARVGDLRITGVERQAAYADLARRNFLEAGLDATVVTADLAALPRDLRQRSFDHVFANPPYFPRGAGTGARDAGREAALREDTPLAQWIDVARARLIPRGWLTMILSVDRVPDALTAMAGFGAVALRPIAPRMGRPAGRVLIQARKGGGGPFRLLAPLVLHAADRHDRDGEDHTNIARAVLRDAGAVPWS